MLTDGSIVSFRQELPIYADKPLLEILFLAVFMSHLGKTLLE